jgi:hypothetical protein
VERERDRDHALIEPPIEHRDVTTIMGQLADIHDEAGGSASSWRTRMAKKRKYQKVTPEEEARIDERQRRVRERIAEREAREQEQARKSA